MPAAPPWPAYARPRPVHPTDDPRPRGPRMSAPRRWARRAVLSMLAGSGLTVAGFGGPLAGGALGAEAPAGTATTEDQTPPVTETTPQAATPAQEANTTETS